MKQNSLENKDNSEDLFKEVNLMLELLIPFYRRFKVSRNRIYDVSMFLYSSGGRCRSFNNRNFSVSDIDSIYEILISKYREMFDFDYIKIYGVSIFLVINGIRDYMFNNENLDIDEIVRYLANKRNCIKFSNVDNNDNEVKKSNNKNGKVVNMLDYLSKKSRIRR